MSYQTKPQAFIAVNKGRSKVHPQNKVYLNDKTEFQIELFNSTQKNQLAMISFNGKESKSGLVLKPGQRYFLDRFVDESKKLLFDTYEVENSSEAKAAISKNGLIKVEFFDEKEPQVYFPSVYTYTNTIWNGNPNNLSDYYKTYGSSIQTKGQGLQPLNNILRSSGQLTNSTYTTTSCNYNSMDVGGQATMDSLDSGEFSKGLAKSSLETGRVEKGSQSDQKFTATTGEYNFYPNTTISYTLLPVSVKPVEVSELKKYCTNCGSKIDKKWKFCSNCSNPL